MRVTERMIYNGTMRSTQTSRANLAKAQEELSSGKRVQAPGDDPAASAMLVRHKIDTIRLQGVGTAAQRASDELNAADQALDDLNNVVTRAQQIASELGSDSYAAEDREAGGQEVDGLIRHAITSLNTRFGDRFLFGGYKDSSPPFDTTTGAYLGDDGVRRVEVAPGQFEDSSVKIQTVVGGGASGVTDLMQTLKDLSTALHANDAAAARSALPGLNAATTQIATGRSKVGTSVNIFDAAVDRTAQDVDNKKLVMGRLADADVYDASSRVAMAQYALDAALTAAAKSFSLTLADRLR